MSKTCHYVSIHTRGLIAPGFASNSCQMISGLDCVSQGLPLRLVSIGLWDATGVLSHWPGVHLRWQPSFATSQHAIRIKWRFLR